MRQTLNTKTGSRTQDEILRELRELKAKMKVLSSLRRFEELARSGRRFARQNRIKLDDVLKGD